MKRRHPAVARAALIAGVVLAALAWVVLVVGGCIWAGVTLEAAYPSNGGWGFLFTMLGMVLLVGGPLLAGFVWMESENDQDQRLPRAAGGRVKRRHPAARATRMTKSVPVMRFVANMNAAAAAADQVGSQMSMFRQALNASRPHPGALGIDRRAKVVRR